LLPKVAGVRYLVRRKHQKRNLKSHVAVLAVVLVVLLHVVTSAVITYIIIIIIAVRAAIVATAATVAHVVVIAATVSDLKVPCHRPSSEDQAIFTWLLGALILVGLTMTENSH